MPTLYDKESNPGVLEPTIRASGYRHVYGPVPSRRLGRSLGIDLVPHKYCSYDCVYCQLGRTTKKTIHRQEYVPIKDVLNELKHKLEEGTEPDYISLAGSGEPTLNIGIEDLIIGIKKITDIPLAVLTNGSLLWKPDVQKALMAADVVLPSLDAGDEQLFQHVNRPHKEISFIRMVNGIRDFVKQFPGEVWLEILLLAGITGLPKEVKRIASIVERIAPERVQLNTVSRPPSMDFAISVPDDQMREYAKAFRGNVDIISHGEEFQTQMTNECGIDDDEILALLCRRPCTSMDVANGLGIHVAESLKHLNNLTSSGKVKIINNQGSHFYQPVKSKGDISISSLVNKEGIVDRYVQSSKTAFWHEIEKIELNYIVEHLTGYKMILSVGCGPALIESELSQHGFYVTAMDISLEFLDQLEKVNPVAAQAEKMPFRESSFDAVVYVASLQFIEDIKGAIEQTYQILRPTGAIMVFLLNPLSDFVAYKVRDRKSYFHSIKHMDLNEIEDMIKVLFTVQSEYYLGIHGQRIFSSNNITEAALYVIQGVKRPSSRESRL